MRAESLRQRHARIDSARAPGWDSARRSGDRREQPSHYDKYDRIRDRNSKELTLESALQAKDTDGTDAQTQTTIPTSDTTEPQATIEPVVVAVPESIVVKIQAADSAALCAAVSTLRATGVQVTVIPKDAPVTSS